MSFLRPPKPQIIVLPDAHFFTHIQPLDPGTTPENITPQIELALETHSPFPITQLYYGYLWQPGAPNALVYAAYRKRFLPEETENWSAAQLVLPSLAIAALAPATPNTHRVIDAETTLTHLHWPNTPDKLPATIRITPTTPDAPREKYLAQIPSAKPELWTLPAFDPDASTSKELRFDNNTPAPATLPAANTDTLDIRDKTELAQRRRAQRRDLILYRTLLVLLALLALCVTAELLLILGKQNLQNRAAQNAARAPEVARIEKADTLARQIERLSAERLLPLEMLNVLRDARPAKTQLLSIRVDTLDTISATARTTIVTETDAYRKTLEKTKNVASATLSDTRIRDGVSTFTLQVKFIRNTLNPEAEEPPPPPPAPPPTPTPVPDNTPSEVPVDPNNTDPQQAAAPSPEPDPAPPPPPAPEPEETTNTTTTETTTIILPPPPPHDPEDPPQP